MRAVRYHGPGDVRLETVATPVPGAGEVLVEIKAAALCHTELHFLDGTLNLGVAPITLGHEGAGVIVDGDQRIGERVLLYYYSGCGGCEFCPSNEQLCGSLRSQLGFLSDGCLAKYVKVDARCAIPIGNLSFPAAAPVGCGVTTAVHAAKRGRLRSGEKVLILGCNGVGLHLVQLAKHLGCAVYATARKEIHLAKARSLGAITNFENLKADVIFECVGTRETMASCVGFGGMLAKRGRLVLLGYAQNHDFVCHPIPLIVFEQSVVGSVGATFDDAREAIDLVQKGVITTVLDSTIPLAQFSNLGIDKIRSSTCIGKIIVDNFDD
ncbi:hypothetical protein CTAYLR_005767 [Chrysophaeum taylorii]|uniref:Enoyl reductase (ER) domain-containing protein n=1 Tax=Chrysophaeum taylorii TaxID=2483200 RepID=A0AAD7UI30_9STRA|nr:hypothetical protein CTAYLR_005767 [Chrysophaeum taylorii]